MKMCVDLARVENSSRALFRIRTTENIIRYFYIELYQCYAVKSGFVIGTIVTIFAQFIAGHC